LSHFNFFNSALVVGRNIFFDHKGAIDNIFVKVDRRRFKLY